MSKRVRYTINDINKNRFYQMPKFLFEGEFKELSNNARVLYSLLRDRHNLSLQNEWINKNNEVYLIYTRKNMKEMLGLADKTVKKAVDQLKEFGLIEEEHMGLNKANRIYLTSVDVENTGIVKTTTPEQEDLRFQNRNIYDSRTEDFTIQEPKILRSNDTDINDTDINDTDINDTDINDTESINQKDKIRLIGSEFYNKEKSSIPTAEKKTTYQLNDYYNYKNIIIHNIDYDYLKNNDFKYDEIIDDILELIVEIVTSKKETIRVNGEPKSAEIVKSTFLKLNSDHIIYAIKTFKENKIKANNVKAYLTTVLYNAPLTINSYYTNLVQHDLNIETNFKSNQK